MTGLELGPAVVLAVLIWCAGRVAVAVVEGRRFNRHVARSDELLHHVDAVGVAARDTVNVLEDIGETLGAVRDAVERAVPGES